MENCTVFLPGFLTDLFLIFFSPFSSPSVEKITPETGHCGVPTVSSSQYSSVRSD